MYVYMYFILPPHPPLQRKSGIKKKRPQQVYTFFLFRDNYLNNVSKHHLTNLENTKDDFFSRGESPLFCWPIFTIQLQIIYLTRYAKTSYKVLMKKLKGEVCVVCVCIIYIKYAYIYVRAICCDILRFSVPPL